jgi:hypothetical protein
MRRWDLKHYTPSVVQYVRDNLETVREAPDAASFDLREKGHYSNTTYLGDIERSVKRIVKLIDEEKPLNPS